MVVLRTCNPWLHQHVCSCNYINLLGKNREYNLIPKEVNMRKVKGNLVSGVNHPDDE